MCPKLGVGLGNLAGMASPLSGLAGHFKRTRGCFGDSHREMLSLLSLPIAAKSLTENLSPPTPIFTQLLADNLI